MKAIGGASLVGLLLALAVIYWLQPLNNGAMALVLLVCMSASNTVVGLLRFPKRERK